MMSDQWGFFYNLGVRHYLSKQLLFRTTPFHAWAYAQPSLPTNKNIQNERPGILQFLEYR